MDNLNREDDEGDKNINTEYELLAQEIYKCLLKAEGFEHVEVKHDIKLKGRSGCNHQIDVYWEFRLAGETHRVAIECKNFSETVSVGRIRDFFGVVHDVGNMKGIFVSKKGFQSGSKKFADYYNISLKELRSPLEKDWQDRMKTIKFEIHILPTEMTKIDVDVDFDWMAGQGILHTESDCKKVVLETNKLNINICVYDRNGNAITNFLELEQQLPYDYKAGKNFKHTYEFPDGYMESNFGKIKVKAIRIQYDVNEVSTELVLDAEEITKAIIKDVKTGEIKFIKTDGGVI